MTYGVFSYNQIGDSVITAGAVRNVRAAHPELEFNYMGWARELWYNNPDLSEKPIDNVLPRVHYGPVEEERTACHGNVVEGFTRMLCIHLGIPMVPIVSNLPQAFLTEEEKEASKKWKGYWLLNANSQRFSRSKGYPHWQKVVDLLKNEVRFIQVGSDEGRNYTSTLVDVIDYRGRSQNLRHYMTMIYGCDGILSPPSGIVNIGAAFGKKAVVLDAARELPKLLGYPDMEFITNKCCGYGEESGCIAQTFEPMKPRACSNIVVRNHQQYSLCMDMIPPEKVVEAVINKL